MFKLKEYDFKRYNISLILLALVLGVIGAYLIKQVQVEDENLFTRHLMGLFGGFLLAGIVSIIDYHFICKFYIALYFLNIGLLLLVKVPGVGVTMNHSQRWINLIFFQFQPSELSKIIMILFMAKFFTVVRQRLNTAIVIIISIVIMAVPTYFIATQPNLSTSLVMLFIFVMMIFSAGLSYKIIIPIVALGIPSFIGLFWYIQQDYQGLLTHYQQGRVLSILNPELYPETIYQQVNSIQAIGSGQLYGKLLSDTAVGLRGYKSVPISESDFIFSVVGEELGFIGSCLIITLFAVLISKCLLTAKKAPDYLGTLIAIGIASMFMFQVFVNVGVATSILPNTGIPLPFLSSGLSSLVSSMIAIGILLNIRLQRKKVRGYTI